MKRIATLLVCLVFAGGLSLAQNAADQPATGSRVSQDQTPGTGMMGMHHMPDMSKMREQMVKDMQADLDSMRFWGHEPRSETRNLTKRQKSAR